MKNTHNIHAWGIITFAWYQSCQWNPCQNLLTSYIYHGWFFTNQLLLLKTMAHMVTIKLTPTYFLLWHRSSNCSFAWKSGFNVLSLWDFSSTLSLDSSGYWSVSESYWRNGTHMIIILYSILFMPLSLRNVWLDLSKNKRSKWIRKRKFFFKKYIFFNEFKSLKFLLILF